MFFFASKHKYTLVSSVGTGLIGWMIGNLLELWELLNYRLELDNFSVETISSFLRQPVYNFAVQIVK